MGKERHRILHNTYESLFTSGYICTGGKGKNQDIIEHHTYQLRFRSDPPSHHTSPPAQRCVLEPQVSMAGSRAVARPLSLQIRRPRVPVHYNSTVGPLAALKREPVQLPDFGLRVALPLRDRVTSLGALVTLRPEFIFLDGIVDLVLVRVLVPIWAAG